MTQKQRKPKERKITDVQAIKEFYMTDDPIRSASPEPLRADATDEEINARFRARLDAGSFTPLIDVTREFATACVARLLDDDGRLATVRAMAETIRRLEAAAASPNYLQNAACAHLRVTWVTQSTTGGERTGWWQCADCATRFFPSSPSSPVAPAEKDRQHLTQLLIDRRIQNDRNGAPSTAPDFALAVLEAGYRRAAEPSQEMMDLWRWCYALNQAGAQLALALDNAENREAGTSNEWPAQQEWTELVSSSHSVFMHRVRDRAFVPHDAFLAYVRGEHGEDYAEIADEIYSHPGTSAARPSAELPSTDHFSHEKAEDAIRAKAPAVLHEEPVACWQLVSNGKPLDNTFRTEERGQQQVDELNTNRMSSGGNYSLRPLYLHPKP
jgi:hypothetical protein